MGVCKTWGGRGEWRYEDSLRSRNCFLEYLHRAQQVMDTMTKPRVPMMPNTSPTIPKAAPIFQEINRFVCIHKMR